MHIYQWYEDKGYLLCNQKLGNIDHDYLAALC